MKVAEVRFRYHPDSLPIRKKLRVVGSWNEKGEFNAQWTHPGSEMLLQGDGSYAVTVKLQTEADQTFYWGVKDEENHWMFFEYPALEFQPRDGEEFRFELGLRHKLGLHRRGSDGLKAAVWAPRSKSVSLVIQFEDGSQSYPMSAQDDIWSFESLMGWRQTRGRPYGFEIQTACGAKVLRADPYARVRQGPQRGVNDLFVTSDGQITHRYAQDKMGHHLLRFVVSPTQPLTKQPYLRLFRDGRVLKKAELKALFGSKCKLPKGEYWWEDSCREDGRILLQTVAEGQAFSISIGPEKKTRGLSYELSDHEGQTFHDSWSQGLTGHHNWSRLGLSTETLEPPSKVENPAEDIIIYEAHVGSVLGQARNLKSSTFRELSGALGKIKALGFNTIALMPTNATEGWRDWGYLGTSTLAHHQPYAAPGETAAESLLSFVNEAHSLGMRVYCDVVYNHVGGYHNDLWGFNGKDNCWFERSLESPKPHLDLPYCPLTPEADKDENRELGSVRETPWGAIPAFNRKMVSQFYIDHAMDQIQAFGFDGIRFDFTHLIHAAGAGDSEGWQMLQAIHRRLDYFYPEVKSFAEEFPPHEIITRPVAEGGAGFHGMWNTEHQHRLVFDHHRSSVTQSIVEGLRPDLETLLHHILQPKGFARPTESATVLSNHDEVGNAHRLYHLVKTHERGFDIARLVCSFSLLCPGYPILFQGTEDLAQNFFSWGLPHTWDSESLFLAGKPSKNDHRFQHRECLKQVLEVRRDNRDLWADREVSQHFVDSERGLLALKRGSCWILGNFSPNILDLTGVIPKSATSLFHTEKARFGHKEKATRGLKIGGFSLKVFEAL